MKVINWEIIKHPMNWVILFLMVFIGSIAIHFLMQGLGVQAKPETK